MTDEDRAIALHKKLGVDQMLRQNDPMQTILAALAAVRAEEREACAKVAENLKLSPRMGPAFARSSDPGKILGGEIASAIRTQGGTGQAVHEGENARNT